MTSFTTGDKKFAMCLLHTAKPILPTAKTLPCATHGKDHTVNRCWQRQPLPCAFCRAHGKEFAVCTSDPRQNKLMVLAKHVRRVCQHTAKNFGKHKKKCAPPPGPTMPGGPSPAEAEPAALRPGRRRPAAPAAGSRPSAGLGADGTAPACTCWPEAWPPPPPLGSRPEVAGGVERGGPRRLPPARACRRRAGRRR